MYKRVAAALLVLSIIVMGVYPQEIFQAAANGVRVWFDIVLPAVFPSMVIIRLLSVSGTVNRINGIFGGFMKVFGLPESSFEAFSGGFLSGYPSGGKITGEMLADGKISRAEAEKLFLISNNPGIFFIMNTVGAGILKNSRYGYVLLVSAVLSSVFAGMTVPGSFSAGRRINCRTAQSLDFSVLKVIIMDSMYAVTRIGGFIILFSVISKGVSLIIPFNDAGEAVFFGIMEMTGGISRVSELNIPMNIMLPVISAMISFGGFSVIGQCMSMVPQNTVGMKGFIKIRIRNGVFALGITYFICIFMKI